MKKTLSALFMALLLSTPSTWMQGQVRTSKTLGKWLFSRDSIHCKAVKVPHDWAISGPFDKKWDLQQVAITQNGETQATEKSGRSGALPWIGEGWYKAEISVDASKKHHELWFDGAMAEPTVYVNGQKAGYWAYGYNAFRIDITPYLYNKGRNSVVVHLQNLPESSRWYPGVGLYRPVALVSSGNVRLDDWSIYFRTFNLDDGVAAISVGGNVLSYSHEGNDKLTFRFILKDNDGTVRASEEAEPDADDLATGYLSIENPKLWSPESPTLYTFTTELYRNGTLIDRISKRVGIRTVKVSMEHGFELNGVSRKIKGVCLHHDLGPLGAAVNKDALIRQVKILKDMGCDAIRTSHNMPSTMQMEVYDSLGMMVMAESFDMWLYPKCKNGYARFFSEWADKDITNLVLNHRNHPSLIMYSIGNEIPEQWSEKGVNIARHLQDLCYGIDPTLPVTQGMDRPDDALRSGFAQVMEVPRFNYRVHKYSLAHDILPQGFLLGSETASTVSSRGVYKFPVTVNCNEVFSDGQISSYDTRYCSWSNLPETDFAAQDDYWWTIGQFVWTGFDYLGEPTPYDEYWPSRSSYFGICDLAGIPKDRYYLYRSQWNKREHTVHLLPHWTWPDREGQLTPVYCYTDGYEGELFINGKSQGRVRKDLSKKAWDVPRDSINSSPLLDRYRLRWNNVLYEPGEIRVVVYDEQGNKIGEDVRRTAGKPASFRIDSSQEPSSYVGDDLVYLTVTAIDANGTEVPYADNELKFSVSGDATFKCVCNGDATSLESFTESHMKMFSGKLVVTLQRTKKQGHFTLKVTDGRIKSQFKI